MLTSLSPVLATVAQAWPSHRSVDPLGATAASLRGCVGGAVGALVDGVGVDGGGVGNAVVGSPAASTM